MDASSIGAALSSNVDLIMREVRSRAGVTPVPTHESGSFGAQLEASFQARADRLGLTLPAVEGGGAASAGVETSDAAWKRAQLQSIADGHGPGDAMMQAMADAAKARAESRHDRRRDLF